jgi:nucleoside-diphosphate-sugar epimerase
MLTVQALTSPVAVIGATGKLGRLAVQQLIDQGITCRLLVRTLPSSPEATIKVASTLDDCESSEQVLAYFQSNPNVILHEGDVGNRQALHDLVQNCSACLALWGSTRRSKISDLWTKSVEDDDPSHAKQVNYQGVCNLIQACIESPNCKRIVRITGKGEDPTSFFSILINLLGSFAKAWNYQGEQALRASALNYTIIRPGVMGADDTNKQQNQEKGPSSSSLLLADNGGDLPVSKISYRTIASLCVESLEYENAVRCTLTAMTGLAATGGDATTTSWAPLLATVKADRRSFPADMLEQHYAAVRSTLYKIGGVLAVVLAIAVRAILA